MEEEGFIKVTFSIDDNVMLITVEDNGIGMEKSMMLNKNKRLSHTSRATEITRERIKNISYKRKKGVGIIIEDMGAENHHGTRVSLRFPVEKNG